MSEEPIEAWDPPARAEAGAVLAAALRREPARAHAIACGLAPDEGGKGIRYARYENTLVSAKTSVPYQLAFGDLAAFVEVLEAGEPGALELAVAIVAELDHEIVVAAARILLPHRASFGPHPRDDRPVVEADREVELHLHAAAHALDAAQDVRHPAIDGHPVDHPHAGVLADDRDQQVVRPGGALEPQVVLCGR